MQNNFAWLIGTYMVDAMGVWWSKNHRAYPSEPRNNSDVKEITPGMKGEVMSDGAKFAAFAMLHNQQMRKQRKNS